MQGGPHAIPEATQRRLSLYLRVSEALIQEGVLAVDSQELARRAQVQPFLVRKDLAYCGRLGRRGQGYAVRLLQRSLGQVLAQDQRWTYVIVGMAELGAALTHYPWPQQYACMGLFDAAQGTELAGTGFMSWTGTRHFELPALPALLAPETSSGHLPPMPRQLSVQPLETLGQFVREHAVDLAMLAVSPAQARRSAQLIRAAGIGSILNFTGLPLELHERGGPHLQEGGHEERDTVIENVDFVMSLHRLSVQTRVAQHSTHLTEEL